MAETKVKKHYVEDLIAELDVRLIFDANIDGLSSDQQWLYELKAYERTALATHAASKYIALLNRTSDAIYASQQPGKPSSDAVLLKSVSCSYKALELGVTISKCWTAYHKQLKPKQRDDFFSGTLKVGNSSNAPKKFHFTTTEDYFWIEKLWSDSPKAREYRAMFELKKKPTKSQFKKMLPKPHRN